MAGHFRILTLTDTLLVMALVLPAYADIPAPSAATTAYLFYEPAQSTLEGVLKAKMEYGPPNFGENPGSDKRVRIFVLHLQVPVNVKAKDDSDGDDLDTDSYSHVQDVQLIVDSKKIDLAKLVDRKIKVTGTLFEKINADNYTDVLLDVDKVISVETNNN